jgi:deoxyribodipyrimidine photo-lyase
MKDPAGSLYHSPTTLDRILDGFPALSHDEIMDSVDLIDPVAYARTRNYISGCVTRLSPYLTHGVVTVREIVERLLRLHGLDASERLVMELVRKEFFLQVIALWPDHLLYAPVWDDTSGIEKLQKLPSSVLTGTTGTSRVDELIYLLHTQWRLHNHQRMRLASWLTHRGKLWWKYCADWTYYHFLDWELASNHLSRQWVAGTFSPKPYFMNEDNLQKYRPWRTDRTLRGSYEDVADRVFSPERRSIFTESDDLRHILQTPNHQQWYRDSLHLWDQRREQHAHASHLRILSPWKLDERLCNDGIPTVVILDTAFTQLHPWSIARCTFVQRYCDLYGIPFLLTEYESRIRQLLVAGIHVSLDERPDPLYRNFSVAYRHHASITWHLYPWTWPIPEWIPLYKFFPYWKIVKEYLS